MRGPRRLKVESPRNSECGSARLRDLNFSEWWTDSWTGEGIAGITHLKVPHKGGEGMEGTVHRVYCKHSEKPRLMWKNGTLYWLVEHPHDSQNESSETPQARPPQHDTP